MIKTIEHTIRFAGLANAGGALATATIISATAKNGEISNILAVPLGLFAAGAICALLTASRTIYMIAKVTLSKPIAYESFRWFLPMLDKCSSAFEIGMLMFFILGCVAGVLVIAFA